MSEKITIGIVDDNAALLQQLKENLTGAGNIEILFTAAHGEEALQKLPTLKKLPQVILMDIEMPVMNGIEATKAIRQLEPALAGIPIVAMTAHSLYGEMQSCFNAGMNGYVSKPFQPHDLFTAIAEATNPQKENKEAAMVD